MLSIAGNCCDVLIACAAVSHITHSEALHGFATHKLFRLLQEELPRVQIALMHVALWCIGEFSDRLLETSSSTGCDFGDVYCAVSVSDILGLLCVSMIASQLSLSGNYSVLRREAQKHRSTA